MPKRNLLKVIQQLDRRPKAIESDRPDGSYDPNGLWNCSWQEEYGSAGNLEDCINMVSNYILSDLDDFLELMPELCKRRLDRVRHQCLTLGEAGVEDWWSIWYGGDDDSLIQSEH